jgi:Domain of unknown function (DUF4234)
MAEQVPIVGADNTAKIRSPIVVFILILVTLGIYGIFWWYFINREMSDYGRARGTDELGTSPGKSVLAITLGALIIVPAILSYINTFKRAQAAQRLAGVDGPLNGWIALILFVVIAPAFDSYIQSGLNPVWKAQAAEPGGQAEAPAVPQPT